MLWDTDLFYFYNCNNLHYATQEKKNSKMSIVLPHKMSIYIKEGVKYKEETLKLII